MANQSKLPTARQDRPTVACSPDPRPHTRSARTFPPLGPVDTFRDRPQPPPAGDTGPGPGIRDEIGDRDHAGADEGIDEYAGRGGVERSGKVPAGTHRRGDPQPAAYPYVRRPYRPHDLDRLVRTHPARAVEVRRGPSPDCGGGRKGRDRARKAVANRAMSA